MSVPTRFSGKVLHAALASLLCIFAASAIGQIRSGVFTAVLQPTQETPPILASNAFGNAFFDFDVSTSMLCYSITYSSDGLPDLGSGETAAHIHGPAEPGVAAGIVFNISPVPSPVGSPKEGCVGPFTPAQRTDLANGLMYLNIHSNAFPGGEIRGQILLERTYP